MKRGIEESGIENYSLVTREDTSRFIENINNKLSSYDNNITNLHIDVFNKEFLDLFKRMRSDQLDTNDELALKNWTKISGGVRNRVNVVDSNGNILFIVPALFNRGNEITTSDYDFPSIIALYRKTLNYNYVSAENLFSNVSAGVITKIIEGASKVYAENAKLWDIALDYENNKSKTNNTKLNPNTSKLNTTGGIDASKFDF